MPILTTFAFLMILQDQSINYYDEALRELYAGRSEQAKQIMRTGLNETGSEKYFFGLAWIELTTENYSEAERLFTLIVEGNPTKSRLGSSFYSLGIIEFKKPSPDFAKSREYLEKAVGVFHDNNKSLANTYAALAELGFASKDFALSQRYLFLLFLILEQSDYPAGDFYYLQGHLEWVLQNYQGAFNYGMNSYKYFQGSNTSKEVISLINMSIYSSCLGLPENKTWLLKAQGKIKGFERLQPWIEAAQALIDKCNDEFVNVASLREKRTNQSYSNLVDFIERFDCIEK